MSKSEIIFKEHNKKMYSILHEVEAIFIREQLEISDVKMLIDLIEKTFDYQPYLINTKNVSLYGYLNGDEMKSLHQTIGDLRGIIHQDEKG